jgi:hypothetical protein
MRTSRVIRAIALCVALLGFAAPAVAQQTGTITGTVTATDGSALPGVTVEARSTVLPTPRVTVTGTTGDYRLPALPPGDYTVTFTLSGMQTVTRQVTVQLSIETPTDVVLGVQGVTETVTVTAGPGLVNRDAPTIQSSLGATQFAKIPVGQEYRDLIKLIPGVQYSQDLTRGPSAGGSGQDNVYQFDGVNVTLPLFGTLSAEPASHDIAQITMTKGGARAIDFDRSGGFSVDSVSKSGTSRFSGELGFQFQSDNMAAELDTGSRSRYQQDRTWTTVGVGGPLLQDKVFFYGSYYRPYFSRDNRENAYGTLPDFSSARNEGFGKLTFTPTRDILLNFSYRGSHRLEKSDLFAQNQAPSSGTGYEAWQRIGTVEGSWIIDARSYATFRFTDFTNENQGRPDNEVAVQANPAIGSTLDVNNLDQLGLLVVPLPVAGQTAFNTFIQPIIDRYGYVEDGVRKGGGTNGFGSTFDRDDFFRTGFQMAYNVTLDAFGTSHDLHAGYQRYTDSEDLTRRSNGYGVISVPGGRTSFQGQPIFYTTSFQQQGFGSVPPTIHSEYQSQSIELNDTIRWKRWTFNAGVLMSNDTLYGQGLRPANNIAGFERAPGVKYKMYEIPFGDMIQPRVGATWAYNGRDSVFVSYARYNPAASSLPRAASWDRNLATTINAHYDANGVLFGITPEAASSGKLFVEDMTPRRVDEILAGTSMQVGQHLTGRIYTRFRAGSHYWEDTNNNARVAFQPLDAPPEGTTVHGERVPRELYIPNLTALTGAIGSGSSYVIAELDGAYTRFYEVTLETEYRNERVFLRGSYTWSKYYGNFDQDNTTTTNDANIFIGSSFIADGAGRQLWDFRDGRLRGDRPHLLKLYGYYALDWNATVGSYIIAQSGQPWEAWSFEPYRAFTSNTSDTSRYAEDAGSRRAPTHFQIDLNYTQNFRLRDRYTIQATADLFNVFDKQTGYNFQPGRSNSAFGQPRSYFDPRRLQLAVKFLF